MGLAALALLAAASVAGPLDWMAGSWCTAGTENRTCEHWQPMAGGMMLGSSKTVQGDRTTSFEYLRIGLEGGQATYFGSPQGAPAVAFPQAERTAQRVVFVNAGHDYPQRIAYWRDGDALVAEISLADGSKPRMWRYLRVKD
ncbi:MAG: hypothetical protein J7494_02585 [Sphingobium sp.]|nr:hypothetical protein [Sphingobium sp.]